MHLFVLLAICAALIGWFGQLVMLGRAWLDVRDLWSHSVSELDAVGEVNVGSRQNRQI